MPYFDDFRRVSQIRIIMENKTCLKCGIEKPLSEFSKDKNRKDGLQACCKDCWIIITRNNYLKYKAKILQRSKDYYQNNKDKRNNDCKLLKKKYRNTDSNFKIKDNLCRRINNALHGNSKSKRTLELLGCSIEFLKKHLEFQFKEDMTWDNYSINGWHIDHIKPCSSFDLSNPEEQRVCFHYTNLQPLWAEENRSKSNKW
jgi:hypothetical protein